MIPDLWKLREWLTIHEAARYLSSAIGQKVGDADVLRLALDGKLPLSLNLPARTEGWFHPDGAEATTRPTSRTAIEGLWDLSLVGAGRVQIEHDYHWLASLPYIDIEGTAGAWVERDGARRQLTPMGGHGGMSAGPSSAFSGGSVLGVRIAALNALAAQMPAPSPPVAADPLDKSLGQRERATLLTIIAALSKEAKIDISKPSAAGVAIEALTAAMNVRVPARTVEEHLKKIPDALERRAKTSS